MDPSIWDCLNEKQNGEGILLTSCGAELQELMRQMDILVRNKKLEWEAELSTTNDCLALREQELIHSRALLDQKNQEVGILKKQLEKYEAGQMDVVREYEAQLNGLKKQMKSLKEAHEKMQRHRSKRNQVSENKEKELATEIEHLKADLKEKEALAVQHTKDSSEWDIGKRALQHQVESLETQKRAMVTNYERVQQQLSVAQSRLKRSNRMIEEVEGTSQSLLKKLEEELANDKELIQRQEGLIAELQSKTRELNTARHAATGEKYRYQDEADKASCKLKVLDEEVLKLQALLSAQEIKLKKAEQEITETKAKREYLQATVHSKEKIIEAMQIRSPLKSNEDELKQKVLTLEATMESMRKTEHHLREEVKSLDEQLKSSKQEARRLNDCVRRNESDKVLLVNDEIKRLRVKLEEMEASHSAQLCGMKADVTSLSSHLHDRDANITKLGESCAEMERQLRGESQRRDKLDAELQIAASNLQALREQRKSTSCDFVGILPSTPTAEKSLVEAECQLSSLRRNYGKAVERLEDENQLLKSQVTGLKSQLNCQANSDRGKHAVRESEDAISRLKMQEDHRVQEVCNAYEHRIAALEARIHDIQENKEFRHTPSPSNSIIIRSSCSGSRSMSPVLGIDPEQRRIERQETPTRDFHPHDFDPVRSSALSFDPSLAGSLTDKQLQNLLGIKDERFDEVRIPTIEEFALHEEKRVEQLESRIEQHIGDMRRAMDLAMAKYISK